MARQGSTLVMFGGFDGEELGDTWIFDGTTWTPSSAVGPGARGGHAMATLGSTVVLFGGFNGNNVLGDTWIFDGTHWNPGPSKGPQARYSHAMASMGTKVVLFGGQYDTTGTPAGDTWTFDGTSWTQVALDAGPTPSARYGPAMAALGSTAVLFGGSNGSVLATDTWVFDGSTWTMSPATGPSGRIFHAMATQGSQVLMFGGENMGDTWSFNGASWTQLYVGLTTTPSARNSHAMATLP
jgi:hypothetical protein